MNSHLAATIASKVPGDLSKLQAIRDAGRAAWFAGKSRSSHNEYPVSSVESFCWDAGYGQDVRSIEQLVKAHARQRIERIQYEPGAKWPESRS